MATKEFKLPDVGEGVAEGELVTWLVEPGDAVSEDQPVAEVETDKSMVEVPSPYDGTVKELRAEEGEMVPVGEVIITFEVEDEGDESGAAAESESKSESESEAEAEGDDAGDAAAGGESRRADDGPREFDPDTESAVTRQGGDGGASTADAEGEGEGTTAAEAAPATADGRVFAPPSARRLARELGVDLSAISGSGPGGRVTEADVHAAAEGEERPGDDGDGDGDGRPSGDADADGPRDVSTETETESETAVSERESDESATARGTGTGAAEPAGRDRTLAAPATRRVAAEEGVDVDDVPATETRDGQAFVTEEAVREYAAARRAGREAEPTASETGAVEGESESEAGAEPAEAGDERTGASPGDRIPYRGVRRAIGQQMERSKYTAPHVTHHDDADAAELVELRTEYKPLAEERGTKLTYTPFVMKAVALALREFPVVNSTLDEEAEEIVLKDEYHVGVATDTEAGLMVPVVRDVDQKSLLRIARETNELVAKARDRSIAAAEMKGGSFTVTNIGGIGGEYATPIINYPETAILALGAIEKRPRVVDDEVVPRHTLPLSLSVDHRVVDGAVAARFTNQLKEYLENPRLLLLE